MRLWSLHPKYLDSKGLVALWREALLAKAVLEGKTKGYKKHPQLIRFRESDNPIECINQYLECVYEESVNRGYIFNREKIASTSLPIDLTVTDQQLEYEYGHLLNKLKSRDQSAYKTLSTHMSLDPHPLFQIIPGGVEDWENVTKKY